MLTVLSDLLDLFLVLGKSMWGWLGVAAGFGAAFATWSLLQASPAKAVLSAVAFLVVFMLFAWQELGQRRK